MALTLLSSALHHHIDGSILEISPTKIGYLQEDRKVGDGA